MNAEAQPDPVALWLCQLPGLSAPLLLQLLAAFGSAEEVVRASSSALRRLGIAPGLVAKIVGGAREVGQVAAGLKGLQRLGITPLPLASPVYPQRLRDLAQPPLVVYVQGTWPLAQPLAALLGPEALAPEAGEPWTRFARELAPHIRFAALHNAAAAENIRLGLAGVPFGLMLARQRLSQSVMGQVAEGTTTLLSTVPPTAQPGSSSAVLTDVLLALSDALILLPPFDPAAAALLAAQAPRMPAFGFSTGRHEDLPAGVRRLRPGKAGPRVLRRALGLKLMGSQMVQQERLL